MPPGIGYSFQPGQTSDVPMENGSAPGLSQPEVVRLLNLRLPPSGPSPIPMPLLKGQGGGGFANLDAVLAALMAGFPGMRQPQGRGGVGDNATPPVASRKAPPPRVTPHSEAPAPPPLAPAAPHQEPAEPLIGGRNPIRGGWGKL